MKLLSILSGKGFVMFNKEIAREVSVNGAIIFGQLCSSFESFGNKNMLTNRNGKEYFYLTSEVIEEETALTYRQQVKAIKDLEKAGYIEAVIMCSPARKYFHITDKIIQQLLPKELVSFDIRAELNETNEQENIVVEPSEDFVSFDKSEILACNKGKSKPVQKVQAYKKKNEKEKLKNNKDKIVNKEGNKDDIIFNLTNEFRLKGMSKELCLRVVDETNAAQGVQNYAAYLRTCLTNTLNRSQVKHGLIDPFDKMEENLKKGGSSIPCYDWLSS
ncbi:hypothetical protein ACIQAA_27275 [Neobacillus sp. NPDC093182]|uniref:hypothetical protein n=1 Tax=Neobacillus sp. NPDC093182 TaxID=3364297 RepID=UPI003809C7BE